MVSFPSRRRRAILVRGVNTAHLISGDIVISCLHFAARIPSRSAGRNTPAWYHDGMPAARGWFSGGRRGVMLESAKCEATPGVQKVAHRLAQVQFVRGFRPSTAGFRFANSFAR